MVTTRPAGRKLLVRLINPTALLEQWTARSQWTRSAALILAAPIVDTERFLQRLQRVLGERRWALTLLAGAWQRIQYTPTDRFHAYV